MYSQRNLCVAVVHSTFSQRTCYCSDAYHPILLQEEIKRRISFVSKINIVTYKVVESLILRDVISVSLDRHQQTSEG